MKESIESPAFSSSALDSSNEVKLDAKIFEQIWSSKDLNPDVITQQINKMFVYNKTATDQQRNSENYFDLKRDNSGSSSSSVSAGVSGSYMGFGASFSPSASFGNSWANSMATSSKNVYSSRDIQDLLAQDKVETEWTGEKWVAKSFSVYKLTDISDYSWREHTQSTSSHHHSSVDSNRCHSNLSIGYRATCPMARLRWQSCVTHVLSTTLLCH